MWAVLQLVGSQRVTESPGLEVNLKISKRDRQPPASQRCTTAPGATRRPRASAWRRHLGAFHVAQASLLSSFAILQLAAVRFELLGGAHRGSMVLVASWAGARRFGVLSPVDLLAPSSSPVPLEAQELKVLRTQSC